MPLTTYTSGEVLTAASLNANFSFAASNPPSGLTFVTGATFTTATSVSLPDNSFSATYRNYRMLFNITALTSDASFSARLRASGSDNTTSNYFTALFGVGSTGSGVPNQAASQSSFNYQSATSAQSTFTFVIDLINPQVAQKTTVMGGYNSQDGSGSFQRNGAWLFNATTQFDSFTFISDVASSMTGSYRLYGYSEA